MTSKKPTWGIYYFVLFLALYGLGSEAAIGKKYFVRILNNLDASQQLTFQCRSEDDVIGPRAVPPNGQFEFGFRESFYTSFECNAWYSNFKVDFVGFNEKLIDKCGGVHCIWSARADGMYLYYIKKAEYVKEYDWTKA